MLRNSICRSSITKFMESNEVGKAFSVLGILQSLFPFVTKPFFSFLYKMTLEDFPGAFRVLTGSLYIFVLLLLIYTHFGMKKQERENKNEEQLGEEMVHLNNDKWGTVAMAANHRLSNEWSWIGGVPKNKWDKLIKNYQ